MLRRLAPIALLSAACAAHAADAPPAKDIEAARELLSQAASSQDATQARALAARALPAFDAAVQAMPDNAPDCWLLAATAETHLRAGDPKGALPMIAKGAVPQCDAAAFAGLSAWAHEFGTDGSRRGPGAELAASLALYLKSADFYSGRPDAADARAAAFANAGEIALMLGDAKTARGAGLQGLQLKPKRDIAVRCGVIVLAAVATDMGEGAATDVVAGALHDNADLLTEIIQARAAQVNAGLEARPGDPFLSASAGFYALMSGDDMGVAVARRHLQTAADSGFPIPDLSYLRGRVAQRMGDPKGARDLWRKQQRDFPTAAASRLAANDLALSLVFDGGEPSELPAALSAVDAWIDKDPNEAALHETRALLLERMGRKADALAAMTLSHRLEPSPEREAAVARLKAAP